MFPTGLDFIKEKTPYKEKAFFVQKQSQPIPLGIGWDCYFERKYIPHNVQGSYLRVMVDLRRFELPTPTMRMWCAPNCATSPEHKNYTAT